MAVQPVKREFYMIAKKNFIASRKLLNFFGIYALACASITDANAQNLRDDVALVDKMIAIRSEIDLTKELDIHLRLMKESYSGSVYSLQQAKIDYISGRRSSAREAFMSVKPSDKAYDEMVFSYFQYADMSKDSTGKKESAALYFDSGMKNQVPGQNDPKRLVLMKMLEVYNKEIRSDEKKMADLKVWADKNGFVINEAPPIQPFIDANDEAERIVLQDIGVDPKAKVDVEGLEKFIETQIKAEWQKMDYWFFKGVIERARAYTLIGQEEKALSTLEKFYERFMKMDEEIKQSILADEKLSGSQKKKMIPAASFMAGIRYVKGLTYLIQAKKKYKSNKDEAVKLLAGRTGAATQFFLCVRDNKGSSEAFKSILRFGDCKDLVKEWLGKSLKPLKVNPMDIGKAYYSLQRYDKAIEYFSKFKDKAATEEGYEAIYLMIPSLVKSDQLDKVDEFLDILGTKYIKYNKKPNDYYTKMCLYLSGVYKKKMEEETNEGKKFEYDQIRTAYYKRTLEGEGGNAPVAYALANKEFKLTFELQKQNKKSEAKQQYLKAVETYQGITKKYPSSTEAVNSYKRMAQLHEYFKALDKAAEAYMAYSERLATPDVAGRVDKATIMLSAANIYFQKEDYTKTRESLKALKNYLSKEDLNTDDTKQKRIIQELRENSSLLSLFVDDKLATPAKKELRDLKKELQANPEDEAVRSKVAKAEKDLNKVMLAQIEEFKNWLGRYNSSAQVPNVMARLGGMYQEMDNKSQAKATYEKLRRLYPDHEVVKQISLNIVKVHLENDDIESAAIAVKDAKVEELDKDSLRYLIKVFLVEEIPSDMNKETVKLCSEVVLRSTNTLLGIYNKEKADMNKLHWTQYRKARALYNLGKYSEAKSILDQAAKEKPLGPYIFDIRFLLGAIASQSQDFEQVHYIYSRLKSLSMKMNPDLNRTARIDTEYASAYFNTDNKDLVKKGRNLAMMSKDINVDLLEAEGALMVQKAHYLFIYYSKKMGDDIVDARKEFLKKYPTSPYALRVRRL